ncbi:MAG TPA: ROK family transcriptional regulator [Mycobacteriales bacterium]|nr:ROK family transcriptional regulator [Mycobacteriales bacterium]
MLDTIRLARAISRVELAHRTGLTAQTVSSIARRLLEDGLIEEGTREPSTGGKPRTPLRVNPSAGAAVGVHVDPHLINVMVIDLGGNVLYSAKTAPPTKSGATPLVDKLAEQINAATADPTVRERRLLGVGIAVPGPIDRATGQVLRPPNMPGVTDVPLRKAVTDRLDTTPLQVVIENDATAAAIGEHWFGGDNRADDFVYLYLGTGVGAGLFIDGNVYRGVTGNGGEIGHCSVNESGPLCDCGNRGCLELYCSPRAVVAAAGRGTASSRRAPSALNRAYAKVCTDATTGDAAAVTAVETASSRLATATLTLVNVLDITHVVLGGPALLDGVAERYLEAVRETIRSQAYTRQVRDVSVERSLLGVDAAAFGAASSVFHEVMAPRLPLLPEQSGLRRSHSRVLESLGRAADRTR